jgi:hypothetical protein
MELRQKQMELGKQLNFTVHQQQSAERDRKRSALTLEEIGALPAGVRTYTAVGRMCACPRLARATALTD